MKNLIEMLAAMGWQELAIFCSIIGAGFILCMVVGWIERGETNTLHEWSEEKR